MQLNGWPRSSARRSDGYTAIIKLISELEDLLADPRKILQVITDGLLDLEKRYGDDRDRIEADSDRELTAEDLVASETWS